MAETAPTLSPLEEVTESIRKAISDPSIIFSVHHKVEQFPALSTGVPDIDKALCGGIPEGRIVELYGGESSGKTTVMLHCIAEAQKRGDIVFFIDAENSLDMSYAKRIGVDTGPDKMMFTQPNYGEQTFDIMTCICDRVREYNEGHEKKMKALIVIDSVAALMSKQEFQVFEKKGMDHSVAMGARARMLSENLPYVCNRAAQSGVSVVFINQMRDKVGVTWGPTTTTPGGRALKFYASVRICVTRIGLRKIGESVVGIRSKLVPVKSKLYPIFDRQAEFYIGPNGIDVVAALVEKCLASGVIGKSGTWLSFGDVRRQGAANFEDAVREDPVIRQNLEEKLAEVGASA